jgi:hypothetical protein
VKKWVYLSILVVAALTLALVGWVAGAVRAPFRRVPHPAWKAA